jgi:hypothetical protein
VQRRKAAKAGLLAFLLGLLLASPAHALRCGQRLIAAGDHASRVLRFCGEPLAIESSYAQRLYVGDKATAFFPYAFADVRIDEWTYNFGPQRLMRVVRIENGIVTDIRSIGYGFHPH